MDRKFKRITLISDFEPKTCMHHLPITIHRLSTRFGQFQLTIEPIVFIDPVGGIKDTWSNTYLMTLLYVCECLLYVAFMGFKVLYQITVDAPRSVQFIPTSRQDHSARPFQNCVSIQYRLNDVLLSIQYVCVFRM